MTNIEYHITDGASPFQRKTITLESFADIVRESKRPFFIYGASPITEHLIDRMFQLDLLPKCLCDSNSNKHRTKMFMLPVASPEDAAKDNPSAICAIAIKVIATCYEQIFARLEAAGCSDYYIIDWDLCHYTVPDEWITDLKTHVGAVISCAERFADTLSQERYREFILSYLSGKVSARDALASFKPKDGHPLKNDIFALGSTDTLLSCRCGLDRQNETFINTVKTAKQAHLLEPTLSGRVRTSELLSETEDEIFLYPFFPSAGSEPVEFDERHCFVKYIDLEDFFTVQAPPVALDAFADIKPTVLYLDMTGFHIDTLKTAQTLISENHPALIITGFRLASEAVKLIDSFPDFKWHMRHFGGQNMREGYALIAYT